MERSKKVILSLLTLTSYVIVGVQWAQASVSSSSCSSGKYLNGSSGFFSSPNFPNNYPQNSKCTWNITVPSGYIIKINFLHFKLDPSLRDRVTITNVASSGGTLYGQSLPDPVYSVGNSIQVSFTSVTNQYSGFNASYTAVNYESVCPNLITLNDTSGVITSPFYPRPYLVNRACSWKITASKGYRVTLVIEKLNIQPCGVFCTCDYLEIQNGFFSGDGSPRERLCGLRNNYIVYYSFHESLKVLFVSDGNADDWYRGFKATYTQVNYTGLPAACTSGEFLNGSSGLFSSPNFPNNFPQYSRCTWNITVPSGYIMKINFLHFQLGWQWSGAWLTITNVTLVGDKLDGFSLPSPLYSVGNSIQVVFTSLTNQYSGFNASYTAVNYESVCPNLITLNDAPGVITSPFYPSSYSISQTCSWQITASKGKRVKLVIEVLNVQPCRASCSCGYLEVQNGSFSGDGAPKGKMCGRLIDYVVYYSFRENLKVIFVSDDGTNKYYDQVFKATYTQVDFTGLPAACASGQFLTGSSGFFSSPYFPNNYPQYSICTWNITVPSGNIIKISFLHFQLGYRWNGGAQLAITNVASSSGEKLDGLYIPSPVYSVGNSIQVTFTSVTNQNSGFNASYTAISECSNYRFLNESSRAKTFGSGNLCDDTLSKGWYRFSGEAGNQMAESCVDLGQCGTHVPGWLNGSHPAVADGAVQRRVCFYNGFSCCAYLTYISVRNCEGFYIYKLKPVTRCNSRYCGIGTELATKPWTPDPPTFSLLSFAETEAVVQLANRKTLSNGNTVRYFQIIVVQLKKGGTDLGNPADKKYRGIKRKYEDQEEGEPYITAEFSKDESRTTFTVGDGKYYSRSDVTEAVAKYLNGKLKGNTQYAVFQRSFDEDDAYENEGFVLLTTKAKFPTAIVVSVVVVLLVLLILAGAFIVWRRTRHGTHDVTEDTKESSRNLQHYSIQEVEMSGNINPSVELT